MTRINLTVNRLVDRPTVIFMTVGVAGRPHSKIKE